MGKGRLEIGQYHKRRCILLSYDNDAMVQGIEQ
jgi:hypothetical protein